MKNRLRRLEKKWGPEIPGIQKACYTFFLPVSTVLCFPLLSAWNGGLTFWGAVPMVLVLVLPSLVVLGTILWGCAAAYLGEMAWSESDRELTAVTETFWNKETKYKVSYSQDEDPVLYIIIGSAVAIGYGIPWWIFFWAISK